MARDGLLASSSQPLWHLPRKNIKNRKGVHIRLVFHAFPGCLMTRKGFLQQQEKQAYLRWLCWALYKALVFPQSPVETELPVHPTLQSAFHLLIQVHTEQYQGSSTTLLKQHCVLSAVVGKAQMLICKWKPGFTVRHLESCCLARSFILSSPIHFPETENSP